MAQVLFFEIFPKKTRTLMPLSMIYVALSLELTDIL